MNTGRKFFLAVELFKLDFTMIVRAIIIANARPIRRRTLSRVFGHFEQK